MALSRIDKDHLDSIIEVPNLQDLEKNKILEAVQRNSNNYAKLKILFRQMESIKNEINAVVSESIETEFLQNIECKFKKIPGKNYFLYKNPKNELFFSIISPLEWKTENNYVGEYFYDYDLTFQKV